MEFELPHGKARKACLGDFGQAPFELVVSCTMLREHEEQLSVRTYRGFMSIDYNTRISLRTKPNRKKVPLEAEDAEFLNPEEPMEEFLQTLDSSDEEGNDHADAEEIDEVLHELQQDAREQDLARMLEAVREAEIVWNQTQVENDFNLLYSRELGDVPIQVLDAFSVVQGDIFHAIDRMKIPVRHEYKKAFKIALMRAFLEYHPQKLKEVTNVLKENGWDDEAELNLSNGKK